MQDMMQKKTMERQEGRQKKWGDKKQDKKKGYEMQDKKNGMTRPGQKRRGDKTRDKKKWVDKT